MTVDDVARKLRVPKSWVYAHAEAGTLPSRKIGKYRRFVPAEIDEFLAGQRPETADALSG